MNRLIGLATLLTFVVLPGCNGRTGTGAGGGGAGTSLRILSGSENKTLQPIIDRFAGENGAQIKVDYMGSVDIMMQLRSGELTYDAVWPANSLWISLGDKQKRVKDAQSIFWSPVVFGVKRSVAQKLGWIGKDVKVADMLQAAESGHLRFMMTSATQSNSGAAAYLGFLYAFAGKPDVLTADHLKSEKVRGLIKRILGSVNRSSGSSGWLKDLFLQKYEAYDAMVNYEAVIIESNQALVQQGREPLYVVYPSDGLAVADSPLGYIDQKDAAKSELFHKLQTYLLSADVQRQISQLGRRVGPVGETMASANSSVFNPDWGINTSKLLQQIRYPKAEVIQESLDLYQTAFRKPSFTVYCLDFSGSMRGKREESLKSAMRMILDQTQARESMLQATPGDVTVVIPFSSGSLGEWSVTGNDSTKLGQLVEQIDSMQPQGGTDIYSPVMRGLSIIKQRANQGKSFPSVILLTDGQSNEGRSLSDLHQHVRSGGMGDIPVYSIRFGEASDSQLKEIADLTSGRVFDGKSDLVKAFRDAKGYN